MTVFQERPPVGKEARRTRGPRDMAYSMIALLIPIAVLVLVYRFMGGESATVVDPTGTYADARLRAGFAILEPHALPAGWQATSVKAGADPAGTYTLRVGYLGPDKAFLQLIEANGPSAAVIGSAADADRTARIGDRIWQWYAGPKAERVLVLIEPTRTVTVAGQATEEQFMTFATALR